MLKEKSIRGLKTAWLEAGSSAADKPLLFFIHGFPDSARIWEKQIDYFSKTHKVLAPFLRGSDASEAGPDSSRYDIDEVCLDHLEIIEQSLEKNGQRVCVVGHDIGGPHAWALARALGGRLDSLVIVAGPDLSQMFEKLKHPRQLLKSWYIGLFLLPKVPDILLDRWGKFLMRVDPLTKQPSKLLNHYRYCFKKILLTKGARPAPLNARVLVLWGKDDPYLLAPTVDEVQVLCAQPVTVRVLDGGHWLQQSKSEKVNELIEKFLGH